MHKCLRLRWFACAPNLAVTLAAAAALNTVAGAGAPSEASFLLENQTAMHKMLRGMDIRPSGEVDHDFAAMMNPHHQSAIDMAQAELRHGRNGQLRRIAQEIIVEQQQEITAVRFALGEPLPPSIAAPDQPADLAKGAVPERIPGSEAHAPGVPK
jgi:hypothetical protein